MLGHPNDEQTFQLLEKYDMRYVVLYKRFLPPRETDFRTFKSSKSYEEVFENERVVILAPKKMAPGNPRYGFPGARERRCCRGAL